MASTNKTTNLKLNSWIGTDHPTRTDFVYDNNIIDSAIANHTNNSGIHLTSEEKQRVSNPIAIRQYLGTGTQTATIELDFAPRLVIVQKKNYPPVVIEGSNVAVNGGIVSPSYGGTEGLSLTSKNLSLSYSSSASGGRRANFNENGAQYLIISFR